MTYWTDTAPPIAHRGLNLLALFAGAVAALPLALIVATVAYLI